LAKALGVEQWNPAEGSETWEGDVSGSLWRLLYAGNVIDEWDHSRCVPSEALSTAISAARKERDEEIAEWLEHEATKQDGMAESWRTRQARDRRDEEDYDRHAFSTKLEADNLRRLASKVRSHTITKEQAK